MQTIKCPNCGKHFATTYKNCPFCNSPSPVKQEPRKGGKRLAGKQQKPVPVLNPETPPQNPAPSPKAEPDASVSAPGVAPVPSPEPELQYNPPRRNPFWRRFFIFCSIILILAAIFIVASIMKTLFGDKGTPALPESSPVTTVSPSSSADPNVLTGIVISPAKVNLEAVRDTTQLTIAPQPETAQADGVTWNSQNPAVAMVDEMGLVTAVSRGSTTITAACGEWTATCMVTVGVEASASPSSPGTSSTPTSNTDGPSLTRTDFTLASAGESYQVRVSGATGSVAWAVKDPSIATVSENGVVTAVGKGKTTVTATVDGQTLECIVRVR